MSDWIPSGVGPAAMAGLAVVFFISGFVRGYAGFGSSAVIIAALATFIAPSKLVPVTITLEIYASIIMILGTWSQIGWRDLRLLAGGAVAGSPIGALSHLFVPLEAMRIIVQATVLCLATALLAGLTRSKPAGPVATVGVGILSGIINASAGIGGLVIGIFHMSGKHQPAQIRANLVSYFFLVNATSAAVFTATGLLTLATLKALVLIIPVFSIGIWAGSRHFLGTSPEAFRRLVLGLLIVLSLAGLVRTLSALF